MKKFTSLFALLSCLCVVSAQAYEPVTVYLFSYYPQYRYAWWWGCSEGNPTTDFDHKPNFTQLTPVNINGITFYSITATPNSNDGIILNLYDDQGGMTPDGSIKITNDTYIVYYQGDNYVTTEPIRSLGIAGIFNGWSTTTDKFSVVDNAWTYIWDTKGAEKSFKLLPNSDANWTGYTFDEHNTVNPASDFEPGNNGNFHIKANSDLDNYTKFKITATWGPNASVMQYWTINVEGLSTDEYTIGSHTYEIGESNTVDLSNDEPFSTGKSFTAATATYSRSTGENHWGTLCLPFEIKNAPNGATFYSLSSVSATALTFTPISGTIAAGTPVAFKLTNPGTLTINESNVQVVADPLTSGTGLTMKGTFQQKTLSSIYLIYNDEVRPGTNITIPPYRAWFEGTIPSSSGAPLRIEVADTEGLEFVEQEDGTVKAYYDLQGRKLDGARKGLVIENGKIIMVK